MHTEIYRSCQSLRPSILRSHAGRCPLPLRGHHLHFAVHHDRPISVSFLDRWRGHEKLGKEAGAVEGREESYILGYHLIRLSEGFRQPCTSQVSSSLASQLSCKQLSQSNRHIFSRYKQCSARAPYDQEAAHTSSTCGAARQKPGRVIVRHYCTVRNAG